jgi:hypothetical protein
MDSLLKWRQSSATVLRVLMIMAGLVILAGCGGSSSTTTPTGTPAVTLTPTSLTFSTAVGVTSATQAVTVTNSGTATLTFAGFTTAPVANYAQTNNCTSSLGAGASCTVSVTFTSATATTALAGTLSISDNATGSPQTVTLSGTAATPTASVSPSSLTYATQAVGTTSAAQNVTVTNTGTVALSITGTSITGTNSGDFAVSGSACNNVVPNNTCVFSVTFTPTAAGTRTATLNITDNATGSPQTVSLTGTGAVPTVSVTPSSLTFTSQAVGTSSASQPVTVSNTGTVPVIISSIGASGDFSQTNTCPASSSSLAVGANCTVSVTFTPTTSGARGGTLSITDNASGSPQTVSLTGTGIVPTVTVAPSSLTFASQAVGTPSAAQAVTLSNPGTLAVTISSIAASGDFSQANNCGTSLAVSATCTINVTFTPTAAGTRTGTLTITDNASGSPQTVSLTGTGAVPTVTVSAPSLTFAGQAVGTASASQAVTLSNTGTLAATISSIAASGDFSATNNCPASTSSLAAGANCNINVTFTPTASGTRTGTLTITDNASGSPQTVSLTGTGAVPTVTVSTASLTFASQGVGTSSASQPVTVTNPGTVPLTISSIAVSAGSSDFSQTNNCGSTLAASGSCTINVTFTPSTGGTRNGTLTITDNASPTTQTVSLTGTGAASNVSLSTTTLSFSSQTVGVASTSQPVTLNNTGTVALTITNIAVTAGSSDYSQTNTCGGSVAASGSCTISVTFSPTTTGTRTGTITITDNAGGVTGSTQTVALTGTGAVPAVSVSTSSLNFGYATVGIATASQPVTVNNTGTVPLTISSIAATGDFSQTNTCPASTSSLAAGANCTINVTFTPSTIGTRSGTLTITDNAGNVPGTTQTVSLTGSGVVPTATLSTTSLTYTSQTVGVASASQPVTINNTAAVPLAVAGIAVSAGSTDYSQTNNCGTSVAASGNCTINVIFTPSTTGTRTGTLTITDNAGGVAGTMQTVSLTGTGAVPTVTVSPSSLTYTSQTVGTASGPQPVTLSNTGTVAATISSIAASGDFSATNNCPASSSSLAAGANCTINVTFTPTASGTRNGTLTITDNASGSPQTVSLSGTGVAAAPTISLSATTLALTATALGSPSAAQSVTLNNTGTTTLSISSIAASTGFAETDNCVPSVPGSGTCTINVTFTPTTGGTTTGTLTLTDNATGSPQTVALTGLTNAVAVNVNLGPNGNYANGIFVTVTVCEPGTTVCDSVPNVLLDTGSVGLRLLSGTITNLTLPPALDPATNDPFYECVQYGDLSYTWGPMMMASVQLGGESALQLPGTTANSGVPIQVIAQNVNPPSTVYYATTSTTYATTPNPCLVTYDSEGNAYATGGVNDDTVANLGSNGILGVRNFVNDCGDYCAGIGANPSIEGFPYLILDNNNYWLELIPVNEQASNPVPAFSSTDTNGVVLSLPSVPANGQATAAGTLTFGIDTQANNQVPNSATYYGLDCDGDFLQATFNGVNYPDVDSQSDCSSENSSFLDSGSNALYFLDPGTLQAATNVSVTNCADNGWYCTGSTLNLSPSNNNLGLTLYGYNEVAGTTGNSGIVSLSIANADSLLDNKNNYAAFSNLAGSSISTGETAADDILDLGLPFFFGRVIYVGIAGSSTTYPWGYWAF